MKKGSFGKNLKKFGKALFALTLIPYGIATYKELKTVNWMNYWKTIKVTGFVLLFAVILSVTVFGLDRGIFSFIDYLVNR